MALTPFIEPCPCTQNCDGNGAGGCVNTPVLLSLGLRLFLDFHIVAAVEAAEAMASLLPLLYDLLPIIMPSEVQISRERDLEPIPERAEGPPYHQAQPNDAHVDPGPRDNKDQTVLGTSDDPAGFQADSDQGRSCEPIQLLDREEDSAVKSAPEPDHPAPSARTSGPKVFRRDAMMGATDKMCATGESASPQLSLLFKLLLQLGLYNQKLLP